MTTDYRRSYNLEGALQHAQEVQSPSYELDLIVRAPLRATVRGGTNPAYSTFGIARAEDIKFGTHCGAVYPASDRVLLLGVERRNLLFRKVLRPVTGLKYRVGGSDVNGNGPIMVEYVQTVARLRKRRYWTIKEAIGVDPHELLVAHFIARLSDVLGRFPQRDVKFQKPYVRHENRHVDWRNRTYESLRDRFLDSKWLLNPRRERVRQILGEGHPWLAARN